jgi:hypothetical protein
MKWLLWFDLPVLLGFAAAIVLYCWAWDARHVISMAMATIGLPLWFTGTAPAWQVVCHPSQSQSAGHHRSLFEVSQSHLSLRRLVTLGRQS